MFSRCLSVSPVCRRRLMETRRWWRCCGRTRGGRRPGAQSDHWFHWESDSCICCCCCRPAWVKTQTVTALRRLDWVISSLTLMIQSKAAVRPAGISISDRGNSTFLTGSAAPPFAWASHAAESQHEFSDSLFMYDIARWLLWVRPPQGAALSSARTDSLPPERDFSTLYSVFLLERSRSWYLYLVFWLYLILMAARFYLL